MTQIHSDDWGDFAQQVAEATQAGHTVSIRTGPENNGNFVAVTSEPLHPFKPDYELVDGEVVLKQEEEDDDFEELTDEEHDEQLADFEEDEEPTDTPETTEPEAATE